MGDVKKTERLLNLVACLLKARRPVPWSEIRGRVIGYDDDIDPKSLERRFERDKADLKDFGFPIEYRQLDASGRQGYVIERDRTLSEDLALTPEEGVALSLLSEIAVGDLAEHGRSAALKLKYGAAGPSAPAPEPSERHEVVRRFDAESGEPKAVSGLVAALTGHRKARFRYYGINRDSVSKREVHPYGITFRGGNWYLVGRDLGADAIRTFRVSRIRGAVQATGPGDAYEVPEDFDIDDFVGKPPFQSAGGDGVTAEVRFDPVYAFQVRAESGGDLGGKFTDDGDGGVLEIDVHDKDAFVSWVLQYGAHAEVLAPKELRDAVRDAWATIVSAHEGAPAEGAA